MKILCNKIKHKHKKLCCLVTFYLCIQLQISKDVNTKAYWQTLPEDSTSTSECIYEELSENNNFEDYESYFLKLMNVQPKPSSFLQFEKPRLVKEMYGTHILKFPINLIHKSNTFKQQLSVSIQKFIY